MLIYICQDGTVPSGVATYGYHFLRHLPQAQMLLLNAGRFPDAAPKEIHERITLVGEGLSHAPELVAEEISKIAARTKEEIIILPNTGDTPWAATAIFLRSLNLPIRARIRVLGIVHSDMETQYSLAESYWPISPLWIGVSRRCAEETRKRLAPHGVKVYELPYPVEIPTTISSHTEKDVLKIAYVGRLEEPQKRVSRLAEVFSGLAKNRTRFKATVVGDGPASADFKKEIKAAGLSGFVEMPGSLSRLAIDKVWASHEIFVLTSAYEGLPLSLQEAMAAGLCPVVMAVESGLPDLLTDGRNARIVPQGDVKRMAEVLAELSVDRQQVGRLGAIARADVAARFSPKTHFVALKEILEAVGKGAVPAPERISKDTTTLAVEELTAKLAAVGCPIVVYGSGMFGRKIVDHSLALGLKVLAMIDSDLARKGTVYRDIRCFGVDEITEFKDVVFAVGSLQFAEPISRRIRESFEAVREKAPQILSPSK